MSDEQKFRYFSGFVYRHDKEGKEQITYEDLEKKLIQSFGDFAMSPWHKADEEQKDEHVHVIYKHPSTVRLKPVREWLMQLDVPWFNNYFIGLHHPSNYQRYLVHLDSPEKEQFAGGAELIKVINNFPLNLQRELSLGEKMEIQQEIESFAVEYNIYEYSSMTIYLSNHKMLEHYLYFTTHTHHFGKFLDSLRFAALERKEPDLDS